MKGLTMLSTAAPLIGYRPAPSYRLGTGVRSSSTTRIIRTFGWRSNVMDRLPNGRGHGRTSCLGTALHSWIHISWYGLTETDRTASLPIRGSGQHPIPTGMSLETQ